MSRVIVFFLSLLSVAFAQAPIGTIAGAVTDDSGGLIANAAITVINPDSGLKRELKSDPLGQFSVPALPAGRYEVRAQAPGFRQILREATVVVGSTTTVDMKLQIGAVTETVTVAAANSQIAYDAHKVDGVIGRTQIEALPLNGRSFLQLAFLEPGVDRKSVV